MSELVSVLSELKAGDFQSRWETAKQIPNFGEPAIASLIDLLNQNVDDPELQWFVARALGEFNHADAVMALAQLMQDAAEDDVAEIAAQMLAQIGPQSVDALAALLDSSPSRALVVSALAQMQDPVIVPLLIQVVADEDASVRWKVIETLSRFHDPTIIPVLLQGLADLSAKVRQAAIAGISYRAHLFQEHHYDLVALIEPFLKDLDLPVCQTAALALGRLGTNAAAEALRAASTGPIPMPLKLTIVQALGQMSNHQSVQVLQKLWPQAISSLQMVDDQDQTLANAIVKALALSRPADRSTQALIYCLHHQPMADPALQKNIANALGQSGDPQAIPELIQLLGIPDMGVRLHAIAALKQIAAEEAYAKLQALTTDLNVEQGVRDGVAIALQEW
ncbi:HEAT repeat domain-containing protein [Acaryochloris sp. IP29b_bin.137]|uniref:HEAT repeat domain-containing protein n=1 Tax=Acaryochloris sp. IP29b_bin.137 TaxID=2969217 RepID=UPI0026235F86|nr:HEAT repeat domain-containing protein [Acaryochloris sp. IP29b_bin.137]